MTFLRDVLSRTESAYLFFLDTIYIGNLVKVLGDDLQQNFLHRDQRKQSHERSKGFEQRSLPVLMAHQREDDDGQDCKGTYGPADIQQPLYVFLGRDKNQHIRLEGLDPARGKERADPDQELRDKVDPSVGDTDEAPHEHQPRKTVTAARPSHQPAIERSGGLTGLDPRPETGNQQSVENLERRSWTRVERVLVGKND